MLKRKAFFPFFRSDRNPARFNIPVTGANRQILNEAKAAIGAAETQLALDLLSKLHLPTLDAEILALQSRLSELARSRNQGVLTSETENVSHNRLNRDIIQLIATLERELETDVENYGEIRQYLKNRYARRLEQKLSGRQPVNLRRIPTTEGTSPETSATFVTCNSDEVRTTTEQIFQEAHGRLLVTGNPGAGKTLVMLQLALELLETEPNYLPVLLNLATWTSEYHVLETWLQKILPAELGVSKRYAQDILQQNHLILLLDGFDEVKEENRRSCLEAIGGYGSQAQRRYVISSRKQEYREVTKDAPVWLQIEVESLTVAQLESEMERIGYQQPEALPLLQAIRQDALLREAAQTPFYFNTLQLLFARGKRLSDLRFCAENVEGRQVEILERFVEQAVSMPDKYGSAEEKRRWLGFLASRMAQRNMVSFELVDLQYDWWRWGKKELILATTTSTFVEAQITIIVFAILAFIVAELNWILFVVFFLMICSSLIDYSNNHIPKTYTKDRIKWSLRTYFNAAWNVMINQIFGGKLLVFFLFIVIVIGYSVFSRDVKSMAILLFPFTLGTIAGIFAIFNKNHTKLLQINTPYQRFTASAKALHFSILQHWLLRYQLYRAGVLPLRLVAFLNEMSTRHLLETDGATWRFRHRILQEYFAGQWKKQPLKTKVIKDF